MKSLLDEMFNILLLVKGSVTNFHIGYISLQRRRNATVSLAIPICYISLEMGNLEK